MSHNFPQNRDEIGVKIFPHESLVKRGDPNYYHYTPADAVFGDKFERKIDTSSVSPRVDIRRNDFNQIPISQQSVTTKPVYSNELQANRQTRQQAIEEHLEHHDRLEKLADFSVDLTPSPMVENELSFPHQQPREQPQFEAPRPAVRNHHVADIVSEVEREEHEHEYERPSHDHEHDRDNGYENVTETHIVQQHSHEPQIEIEDHRLQDILKKEYREELDRREEERKAEEYVQQHVDDQEYTISGQNDHHAEHQHVSFEEPTRDVTEHQHVHSQAEMKAEMPGNEEQHHVRHGSVDELASGHRVQQGIEKFNEMEEQHQHQKEQHPIEHHQQTQQQHVHQDQHSLEHHVEHHALKHGGVDVPVNRHIEEEVEPKEHHREFNSVRQMVQSVNENERKHKADGHSPEHHVQHHKAKQVAQEYQPRETTVELLHERHEVKLNIEVKKEQQQSSPVRHETTTYSEPKIIEFKSDVTTHHETPYGEPKSNTAYVDLKQDMSPSRRIDKERPDIDSPTRLKTDAIIAQLKSVGVDNDGVKTLKDLKEEKKLAEVRKEAEIKAEVERIKREYTAEKFMNASPTHGGKTGFELPEWKRRQIAQKKADEAAKFEEERLWREFDEWKNGQRPSWIKDVKQRKSQP